MLQSKIFTLCIFLFCLFIGCHAQIISGVVLDKKTNEPIPYSSIYLVSLKSGIYSSESGHFRLNYDSEKDTIIVSAIGYSTYKEKVTNLKPNDNVVSLEPNIIKLEEVIVTPFKKKTMILGPSKKQKEQRIGTFSGITKDGELTSKIEYLLFVKGTTTPVRIKNIIVGCSKKKKRLEAVFRIKFYTKTLDTNKPDRIINKTDIVNSFTQIKSKIITFDIEKENIILPVEGLFVSVEHIGYNLKELKKENTIEYNLLTSGKDNHEEIDFAFVKSEKGTIAGVKFHDKYYHPIEELQQYVPFMKNQKYNVFIQLEVEEP